MPEKWRPRDLRLRAEAALEFKSQQEELRQKAAEQAARDKAMEESRKAVQRAQETIFAADLQLEGAADKGFLSARIYEIQTDEIMPGSYLTEKLGLSGAAKMIFDHYKKEGFSVIVDAQPVPATRSEDPPHTKFYIKVGW